MRELANAIDLTAIDGALRRDPPQWIAVAEAYESLTECVPACFFGGGEAQWKALGQAMETMRISLQRYKGASPAAPMFSGNFCDLLSFVEDAKVLERTPPYTKVELRLAP